MKREELIIYEAWFYAPSKFKNIVGYFEDIKDAEMAIDSFNNDVTDDTHMDLVDEIVDYIEQLQSLQGEQEQSEGEEKIKNITDDKIQSLAEELYPDSLGKQVTFCEEIVWFIDKLK